MQIRALKAADLDLIDEIDATIQSDHYLHIERIADSMSASFRIEERPLPERRSASNPLSDDVRFSLKQLASGIEDGFTCIAEHDEVPIGLAIAVPAADVVELIDLRIDFDRRREGLGSALMFQLINYARERESRAIRAFAKSGNGSFCRLLAKLGFEIAGIDTQRDTNHDLVKEQTTLIWYLPLL